MSIWRQEYVEALKERDKNEKVNYELIDAYTSLADRAAALEAEKVALIAFTGQATASKNANPPAGSNTDGAMQLKFDLAEALRSKGQLQSRLKFAEDELDKLRPKTKADAKLIRDLYAERAILITKTKDRDEELRGKAKLLEAVQDEMLSLNLQLNMAEQRSKKLERDNKDLVDRWMVRVGQEADAMNNASKFS